ncbi:orotidine-5'-phosphate decarboxylase [Rhizopus microsporus var. microsporus]|uniref:Orotidine 5'-phosphate decarboxylase n=2 Tax=Rhizopus microsporus TaxID=58291 RepID=A0A2G4SU84_RHIZD|nr:orotidine-5'-phosphate decarboxylase [Rhizopus microsporus ATCC 52813]ORE11465.1 orotidine-5'-phosphate decarboxylase [Rhizopus microsporus var. microsporus]PHZ12347.1 orotidine-5'-phosphate decarboxylase [Rhizopus microsporus ATCC 52813]
MNTFKSYGERAKQHSNACARTLLELMERKQTNLSVAVDVTTKKELLSIADAVGPYVCVLKTHIDIVEDFDTDLIQQLQELAKKHDFLFFEDRKFADIGNTVKHQYANGIYKIASWSHITNAHTVPGEGIIKGLAEVGLPLGRGLLLLAEMSSKGALTKGSYTTESVEMARRNKDFVFGFIAQHKMNEFDDEDFIVMSPGVGLDVKGDGLGQQYRTPREVIVESGGDVIIVGRGIYGQPDKVVEQAQRYRQAGWEAYLERLASKQ